MTAGREEKCSSRKPALGWRAPGCFPDPGHRSSHWLATGMSFKYVRPVYFEERIECTITITKIEDNGRAEAEAVFVNDTGTQVCYATLSGRLPMDRERELLGRIVREGDPSNRLS